MAEKSRKKPDARWVTRGNQGCSGGAHGCARTIENFRRIRKVVARASGMDLASSLKRNTFLTLGVRPVGVRGPGASFIFIVMKL